MAHIVFDGPGGQLEGLLELKESSWGAVLCHPHPLYGGSMDDLVIQALHSSLAGQNCSTLRFNFRGVGASVGSHDKGDGEADDVAAAVAYLKSQGSSQIVLAGYSFGAAVCLKTDLQVKPDAMVLVAPPIQMFDGLSEPEAPYLVLLGSEDKIVAAEETAAWFRNGQVELIDGADHFFFGVHGEIKRLVSEQGSDLWN